MSRDNDKPTSVQASASTRPPPLETRASANGEGPETLANITARILDRIAQTPPEEREKLAAEAAERDRQELARRRKMAFDDLIAKAGARYRHARLETFAVSCPEQSTVLERLKEYATAIGDHVARGAGVVLFGPSGSGKDHFLVGLAWRAIDRDLSVGWLNGQDLFASFRDAIGADQSEGRLIARATAPQILVISDPAPPRGELTDFQVNTLYRVVDHRYRNGRATWASINVESREKAEQRLSVPVIDRLTDGAVALWCGWPSFRKPAGSEPKRGAGA